jgi:hypothetical protein
MDLLAIVDHVAACLPGVPRLAILDLVEAEWERLCATAEPYLRPLVLPAVMWRLRSGQVPFAL